MPLDYAFLSGLSGKRDWNSIKAERQNELLYQSTINNMRQQEVDKQAALKQQMDEYQNTINEIAVTPVGKDRINERVNEPMKAAIAEKIKKYGGDLETYMKVEGATDMNNYLKTLLNHPETQRELSNAAAIAKYKADMAAGLVERRGLDPNTGEFAPGFGEKLDQYLNGEVEALDYSGAFKPAKFDEGYFGSKYGSENRYKSIPVSVEDYAGAAYRSLIENGLSEQDAAQQSFELARNYGEKISKGATPLRWKSDEYNVSSSAGSGDITNGSGDITKEDDAKYVIEQLGAALLGKNDVYRVVDGVISTTNPETGQRANREGQYKRGTALSGTPLGKFSYTKDGAVNVVDNIIEDWLYIDGKPRIKTTESEINAGRRVKGYPVDRFGYMEVTDDIITGIARANKIPFGVLRQGLKDLGAYGPKVPEAEESQKPKDYTIKGKSYSVAAVKKAADASGMTIEEYVNMANQ